MGMWLPDGGPILFSEQTRLLIITVIVCPERVRVNNYLTLAVFLEVVANSGVGDNILGYRLGRLYLLSQV